MARENEVEDQTQSGQSYIQAPRLTSLLGLLEARRDVTPVDDIPERFDVIGSHVLVLQIVSVLPHVNTKKRNES